MMVGKKSLIQNRRFPCSVRKIQCITGFTIFSLIILFVFLDDQRIASIGKISPLMYQTESVYPPRSSHELLLLYQEELFRVENSAFRPTFHNHRVTLNLNLTTLEKDLLHYWKTSSRNKEQELKIICLKSWKNANDYHPICEISLIFNVQILKSDEVDLVLLFHKSNCSISLKNTSDIESISIDGTFSIDDKFRFTYEWFNIDRRKEMFWPKWPISKKCPRMNLNKRNKNVNELSKLNFTSFQCPDENVLTHSTSRELFLQEQNALSYWLDLQYQSSIDEGLSDQRWNQRRRIPFELSKDHQICPIEFQNWIWKYQEWHQNLTFLINNGSMTIEEQRNRIIELDVRFLIYEKQNTGLADRIIHLISTYLVALLTNRLFIFDKSWPEFIDGMELSLNAEQKLIIPWFSQLQLLNANLSLTDKNYLNFRSHFFGLDRYTRDYDYNRTFPERVLLFQGHTGGTVHAIRSNTSIYREFLTKTLRMNTDNIFGCLYHSLFTYRLKEVIRRVSFISSSYQLGHSSEQILLVLLSPKFSPVGLQIRVGDQTMIGKDDEPSNFISNPKNDLDPFDNYFTCARDILYKNEKIFNQTGEKGIIFLISDSLQIRRSALERWQLPLKCFQSFGNECQWDNRPFYIIANANPILHVQYTNKSKLAFQLGMFDIFLFSLCQEHIITTHSGFGRFSAFASLKQRNIYPSVLNDKHSCRDEGLPLALSAYYWSGI